MKKRFYLTTAIAYVNQNPHIGFALELLYADVLARYRRMMGDEVWFLTGTDEHGQKIAHIAHEHKKNPQAWADMVAKKVRELTKTWNISNDDFIRTTEPRHERGAQAFWRAAMKRGDIYKKSYRALYCEGCESFKTKKDLVDGKCPDHQRVVQEVEEENYFFALSKYQKKLEALFKKQKQFVIPDTKRNEMLQVLKEGVEDVSISRSRANLQWGVPVPGDTDQVMYVWFDALTNYVTALGYGSKNTEKLKKYWPADAHIIGKEINRFHSLLWPAMLWSAGLPIPKQIAVHGWITVDGQKMSKTLGNVIDPFELAQKYPLDAVRYFFLREISFDNDGDFSYERFKGRYAADLGNELGNLIMRTRALQKKMKSLSLPATVKTERWSRVAPTYRAYHKAMQSFAFDEALEAIWKLLARANKRISDEKPWEDTASIRNRKCIAETIQELRHVQQMLVPFMPTTAAHLFKQRGPLFPRL